MTRREAAGTLERARKSIPASPASVILSGSTLRVSYDAYWIK